MDCAIERHCSEAVQEEIPALPDSLSARYAVLTRRIAAVGPNPGSPHPEAFGDGPFALRLKGPEGIARVFFFARVGRRVVMLHCFVKKRHRPERSPSRGRA